MQIATSMHVYVFDGFGNKWRDSGAFQSLKQLLASPDVMKCGTSITEDLSKLRAWSPEVEYW